MKLNRPKLPQSANFGWWIATVSALALALISLLSGMLTNNPDEFNAIAPAIVLSIICCPLVPVDKYTRSVGVGVMTIVNMIVWILFVW
jgi:hypothetical protein